jgi:hypothetical protein
MQTTGCLSAKDFSKLLRNRITKRDYRTSLSLAKIGMSGKSKNRRRTTEVST